ncbi:hypothetical protein HHI36_008974 [Cryptolaemus montrouzieri]|uniref:Reverse transcriptase domain-containing protein n=1 Tax=Cryptolaemus montrouzieri TaxID=559131 RepID=A0ABD2MUF1_9CUCU
MLGDDEFDVAEKLNRFFIDSIDELAGNIPAPLGSFADVHMGGDDCIEVFENITLDELSNIITQMKNKASDDELLSVALLKPLFPVIGYPLFNFVNSFLRTVDFDRLITTMNKLLYILQDWLKINKLKLNAAKTKCMLFGSKSKCVEF